MTTMGMMIMAKGGNKTDITTGSAKKISPPTNDSFRSTDGYSEEETGDPLECPVCSKQQCAELKCLP